MRKPIHAARTFIRGFAVGCLTIATLVTVVGSQNHASRIWEGMPVEELTETERSNRLVLQTFQSLDAAFYRDLSEDDIYAFIDGALQAVDPYSSHVPANSYRALTGQAPLEGVADIPYRLGVMGTSTDEHYVIGTAAPGSPAAKAGVRPGDILVSVEGRDLREETGQAAYEALLAAVENHPGSVFSFSVLRGSEVIEVEVAPAQLEATYVYDLGVKDGIPHIAITGFYPGATKTLKEIVTMYLDTMDVKGLVLDVRSNAGGLVSEVEDMASLFAPGEILIYSSTSRIEGPRDYFTKGLAPFQGIPVAVLTNAESASSSEILAGFFQGNRLGQVIGQVTFGKGSIQTILPLDERAGAIRVTIGKYLDAGGRVIEGKGVVPDILIEPEEGEVLARMPYGYFDEALTRAREWIALGIPPGSIPTHARPDLPRFPADSEL